MRLPRTRPWLFAAAYLALPLSFGIAGAAPSQTQVGLVSVQAFPDHVEIMWFAANSGWLTATVYRRAPHDVWRPLAQVTSDPMGHILFEDDAVTPGTQYDYRLGVLEAGIESFYGETVVDVPVRELALAGPRPNPAGRDLAVTFSLPDDAPARLELFDLSGRRVLAREVGSFGLGRHAISLGQGRELTAGVYLLRLTRQGRTLTARAVVAR